MKKTNKILAVILCLCMMASFTALFASAEDATELPIYFRNITATKFKPDDPETVLQMEFKIEVDTEDEEEKAAILDGIDTVDTNAEIAIREKVLYYAHGLSGIGSIPIWTTFERYLELDFQLGQEAEEKSTIAIAKPVSYENGVLTLDVYSKDGTPGAKMIGVVLDDFFCLAEFEFDFPAGVLANSATGAYSSERKSSYDVSNLATRELEFTKPVKRLLEANNKKSLGRLILILPILPLELMILVARANRVYAAYGVSLNKIALDLCAKAPRIAYWLIKYNLRTQ